MRDSQVRRVAVWPALALLLCACFVASIARLYHPIYGFTGFRIEHIEPPAEAPASQAGPPGLGDQLTEGSPS